ncbi:MAG: hypothetical protein HY870_14425 [Chloroflexi bacterium]|nr:hypothetical protein [Chloroflexota bacterium]
MLKERFIQAIHEKHKVRVTFQLEGDRQPFSRVCAPLDFGPGKVDHSDHLHVWADEGASGGQLLSLKPEQVRRVDILDDEFDPADFVWFLSRDWGQHL